jgi:hypothetical protein
MSVEFFSPLSYFPQGGNYLLPPGGSPDSYREGWGYINLKTPGYFSIWVTLY